MTTRDLYSGPLLSIGRFTIEPKDPEFSKKSHVDRPLFVFPGNGIWIQHERKNAFVADSSLVNFYNQDQIYQRFAINPQGDYCHWFSLSPELLQEILGTKKGPEAFFNFEKLPCHKADFLNCLAILNHLESATNIDDLWLEEQTVLLFQAIVNRQTTSNVASNQKRKLIENVKRTIQNNLNTNLGLKNLSKIHATSPFHLSRTFKQVSGHGISEYRMQQRLRQAAYKIQQGADDFGTLAEELGFSSHSHLSASYRSHYGQSPSTYRNRC